ncbi:MAG: hypothetical protein ACYCYM_03440 [Saccharofermentanales bacterium]
MKKKIIIFTMSFMLILLCSCYLKTTDIQLMCSACSYTVPGMYQVDLKGPDSNYDIVETDQYGRILLRTQSYYAFTDQIEQVLIILQKIESEHIYFYEDSCYLLFDSTDEDIALLKVQNDWDEEINETKLSTRLIKATFDGFLIYPYESKTNMSDVTKSFCDELEILETQIMDYSITDIIQGKELFWFKIQSEGGAEIFYWVIADKNAMVSTLEIKNIDEPTEELATFKRDNGWYDQSE